MKSFDHWLSAACLLGLALVSWLLTLETPSRADAGAVAIGKLSHSQSAIRRRPPKTLGWDVLTLGDAAYENDTLFVPPGTDAVITLNDGTSLALEENSLLVLGNKDDAAALTLTRGAVTSSNGERGTRVSLGSDEARIAPGSRVRVSANQGIDVFAGNLSLGGKTIEQGQSGSLETGFTRQRGSLIAPAPGDRLYSRTVAFQYKTSEALRVQVSRDASFAKFELAGDVYTATSFGTRYWRLVDAAGKPASMTSYFVMLEDVAPALLTPRDHEYLVAKKTSDALFFAWTETDGAAAYLFQVAAEEDFSRVVLEKHVRAPGLAATELDEGIWFWRVHAVHEDGTRSPASAPRSFRLTRKPLPHAPELFDPELELKRQR